MGGTKSLVELELVSFLDFLGENGYFVFWSGSDKNEIAENSSLVNVGVLKDLVSDYIKKNFE